MLLLIVIYNKLSSCKGIKTSMFSFSIGMCNVLIVRAASWFKLKVKSQ